MLSEIQSYSFIKIMSQPCPDDDRVSCVDLYRFKTNNYYYFVELYKHNQSDLIFGVKFYPKHLKDSKNRYATIINHSWNINARKIIATVLNICLTVLNTNPKVSFVFYAERKMNSEGLYIENKKLTQRFKVYKKFIDFFIGPKVFNHYVDSENSIYCLINKQVANQKIFINKLQTIYPEYINS